MIRFMDVLYFQNNIALSIYNMAGCCMTSILARGSFDGLLLSTSLESYVSISYEASELAGCLNNVHVLNNIFLTRRCLLYSQLHMT